MRVTRGSNSTALERESFIMHMRTHTHTDTYTIHPRRSLPPLLLLLMGAVAFVLTLAVAPTPPAHAATNSIVVQWGDTSFGQGTPPAGLTSVTAISAGESHSLALKAGIGIAGATPNAQPGRR